LTGTIYVAVSLDLPRVNRQKSDLACPVDPCQRLNLNFSKSDGRIRGVSATIIVAMPNFEKLASVFSWLPPDFIQKTLDMSGRHAYSMHNPPGSLIVTDPGVSRTTRYTQAKSF
jgi:hypothetical protein